MADHSQVLNKVFIVEEVYEALLQMGSTKAWGQMEPQPSFLEILASSMQGSCELGSEYIE